MSRRLSLARASKRAYDCVVLTRSGVSLNACTQRVFPIRAHQAELHSRVREPGPDVVRCRRFDIPRGVFDRAKVKRGLTAGELRNNCIIRRISQKEKKRERMRFDCLIIALREFACTRMLIHIIIRILIKCLLKRN